MIPDENAIFPPESKAVSAEGNIIVTKSGILRMNRGKPGT
jgi:hypothetical protein